MYLYNEAQKYFLNTNLIYLKDKFIKKTVSSLLIFDPTLPYFQKKKCYLKSDCTKSCKLEMTFFKKKLSFGVEKITPKIFIVPSSFIPIIDQFLLEVNLAS